MPLTAGSTRQRPRDDLLKPIGSRPGAAGSLKGGLQLQRGRSVGGIVEHAQHGVPQPLRAHPAVLDPESVVIGSGLRRSKLLLPPKLLTELPRADVVEDLAS